MERAQTCENCGMELGNGFESLGVCCCGRSGCSQCAQPIYQMTAGRETGPKKIGLCRHRACPKPPPSRVIDAEGIEFLVPVGFELRTLNGEWRVIRSGQME